MFLHNLQITDDTFVTEIVLQDYRSAAIFRKYGINYCCAGRRPLRDVCTALQLDIEKVKSEIVNSARTVHVPNSLDFTNWPIDFLVDYISNVHHQYLAKNLPEIVEAVRSFTESHKNKYPYLTELSQCISDLQAKLLPHMEEEEKIIFPYIKQVAHAYEKREVYSALLVRTLRKPVERIMHFDNEDMSDCLNTIRRLTENYHPAEQACVSHRVAYALLKELDNDLVQHFHLESNILFPKTIAMEEKMLGSEY